MENDPIKNDARRTRRTTHMTRGRSRVRAHEPLQCAICGCADFDALLLAKRSLLEAHHVAGAAHDDGLTIILCRNHHAIATELQRHVGADLHQQATMLERLIAVLRSIGSFLGQLGERLIQWAEQLARFIVGLDHTAPTWRGMPEAQ